MYHSCSAGLRVVPALLLGALALLASVSAETLKIPDNDRAAFNTRNDTLSVYRDSDTVWSATLTPLAISGGLGCSSKPECDVQTDQ